MFHFVLPAVFWVAFGVMAEIVTGDESYSASVKAESGSRYLLEKSDGRNPQTGKPIKIGEEGRQVYAG